MNKIASIKAANFVGIVMLHFLVESIVIIFQTFSWYTLFSGAVSLFISYLYFRLLHDEHRFNSDKTTFFRMTKIPYYFFAVFFLLSSFAHTSSLVDLPLLITSLSTGIYSLYVIIAPKKVIGLDVEIYNLFKKTIQST